jgi:4-amino-4-deoxy-L-arabinose transferase-like glycosyltransferase
LEASGTIPNMQREARLARRPQSIPNSLFYAMYALTLAAAIAIWFFNIRAPLWLDETVSIYLIRGGFAGIISRQVWPDSPTYSCLLWLWTKVMGTGEVMLRVSSLLPMLAAVYVLYRAARDLFGGEVALFTATIFCLHPIIIFASIDIRPYAFAALAVNSAILALVSLRHNDSNWLAALFGLSSACIVQFQLLFTVILPALVVCFVVLKIHDRKTMWRQLRVALIVFAIACLPVIPRLQYMVKTSGMHVFSEPPTMLELGSTLTHKGLVGILIAAVLMAAARHKVDWPSRRDRWPILLCLSLALVPVLTLFVLSVGTSVHVFVPRYRLASIPGIALCWGLAASWMRARPLRLLVCIAAVAATGYIYLTTPFLRQHQYSWKYALDFVEKNASADNAAVLICSDIPEADHMTMPVGPAIEASGILPPLGYYKLTVPVTPLPRGLNSETMRATSVFLQQEEPRHTRFLAMGFTQSYDTLDWLARKTADRFNVRELGQFDGVMVLEFKPREQGRK